MTPLQTCLVALAFVAAAPPAGAQQQRVYQWKDAQGVTHYTDTPPRGAHKVREISRANTPVAAKPAPASETQDSYKNESVSREAPAPAPAAPAPSISLASPAATRRMRSRGIA